MPNCQQKWVTPTRRSSAQFDAIPSINRSISLCDRVACFAARYAFAAAVASASLVVVVVVVKLLLRSFYDLFTILRMVLRLA